MTMVERSIFAGAMLLGLGALTGSAHADCKPLALITSVDLTPAPDKSAEFVPVEIAGTPKLMLLDTGGVYTEITSQVADELHLQRRQGNFELLNIAGTGTSEFATASFAIGRLKADKVAFPIWPGDFGYNGKVAGLLAADILTHYDVSADFGTDKLDLLSQDHCEGKVIYWPASAIAVLPMQLLESGHIVVSVVLDGHETTAIVDTGASRSTLRIPAAESYFGLKLGSSDAPRDGDLPGLPGAPMYRHTFKTLELNGITVSNPDIAIIPDMTSDKVANVPDTGSRLGDPRRNEEKPDMLIGMDVLQHLHIYIAYKEEKLYVTPAGAQAKAENAAPGH
ncbi:MAG: retropepsin-like domain-containing protein [Alphaproteobacteria bacterium]|nr:retropepsin-like domain-containing protein [Alphaproteobacteria bacterium]